MNCLIVDDNKIARMLLMEFVSKMKQLTIVGECTNGVEAYDFLATNPVDLVFLDVEMPGMSGIELLQSLTKKPIVIFLTAKKSYAIDAFDLNVADYIVKPVTLPRLLQAVEKAQHIFSHRNDTFSKVEQDFVFLKEKGTLRKIKLEDIVCVEAQGDYVKIHTHDKWHMVHTTLKAMEEKLTSAKFIKVHRSYIVAVEKIDYIEENSIYINKTAVPLADSYKMQLMDRLNLL
jgi:DNA-binding LytR/AlgR family response regulator